MTTDPKIHVNGPFPEEQTGVPGTPTGDELSLYLVEDANDNAETETNPQSIPGQDEEEQILAALTGQRDVAYNGVANGLRLFYAGYGSDPVDAFYNWLDELESLVLSGQGLGYEIFDETRNVTYGPTADSPGVLFDHVHWEHSSGEPIVCEYRLEGQLSDGVQEATSRAARVRTVRDYRDLSITEDRLTGSGFDFFLGDVDTRTYERAVDLDTMDLVHQYDVPNVGLAESGVQSTISVDGQLTRNDVPDLQAVARTLTDDIHGEQVTLEDAFRRRTWSGAVASSNSTFSAGSPDILEYRVEVDIGAEIQ